MTNGRRAQGGGKGHLNVKLQLGNTFGIIKSDKDFSSHGGGEAD